jgi:hypothetical protein
MHTPKSLFVVLAAVVVTAAMSALAGETYKGRITVADAGCISNQTPNLMADAGYQIGQSFTIPAPSRITVQCDGGAVVCVGSDALSCTSAKGLLLPNGTPLPTSLKAPTVSPGAGGGASCTGRYYHNDDAGCDPAPSTTGLVTVCPQTGAVVSCGVWERVGDEM